MAIQLYSCDKFLHIFLYGCNAADTEGIDQHLGHIRRQEGRKCRSEVNILHTQIQQCQEYNYRLLLIPGNIVGDRQIVNILKSEYFLELQGNHNKRVGIVALAGIQYTRNPADVAKR
ncbi:hypothetical protein D3C86_1888870 [compost metagenome]